MAFHDRRIEPPRYWEAFEDLCLDLYREVWSDPSAQKNGRAGQAQAGTDVYGQPDYAAGKWHGVQCKGKDTYNQGEVTETELRNEVEKAKTFKPALSDWILATTAKKDAKIEEVARLISEQHAATGLFSVHVLGWEDLQSLIGNYPGVIDKHSPDQGPTNVKTLEIASQNLTATNDVKAMVEELLRRSAGNTAPAPADPGAGTPLNPQDAALQARIDTARDLLRSGHQKAAIGLMEAITTDSWNGASDRAKFRLLTNRGAAHYRLGHFEQAADLFMRAQDWGHNDPLMLVNVALAHLLRHEDVQARKLADEALRLDPNNSSAASLRILAALSDEGVTDPFTVLPPGHIADAETIATAGRWYLRHGNNAEALTLLERVFKLDPSATRTMFDIAVARVGDILTTPAALHGKRLWPDQWSEIDKAIELLSAAWDACRGHDDAGTFVENVANMTSLLRFRGKFDEAEDRVNQALAISPDNPDIQLQKVHILTARGHHAEAAALLRTLAKADRKLALLEADALGAAGRFDAALSVNESLSDLPDEKDRRIATIQRINLLTRLERMDDALATAQDMTAKYPTSPLVFATLSRVQSQMGDDAAALISAQQAKAILDPHSQDALEAVYTAESLYLAKDWDGAADIFASISGTDYDTPALRQRINALINADRRQEAIELFDSLSPSVMEIPEFTRAAAMMHERIGDFQAAMRHVEASLAKRPDDIETRFLWIHIADQLGDADKLEDYLNGPMRISPETPVQSRMAFAQALDAHGRGERAFEIAYDTLRTNWTNPIAHYGYQGLVLMGKGASDIIPLTTDAIGINTGFTLEDQPGHAGPSYIIEPHTPYNAHLGEIPPDDVLAKRAIGLRQGDSLKLHDFAASESLRIMAIKHKYLHLLHRSMEEFNNLFPNERGLIKFSIDESKPEATLGKMLEVLREQKTGMGEIIPVYRNGHIPIAVLAKLSGKEVVDFWYGLMELEVGIDVALGAEDERRQAVQALAARPSVILDPLTFWIAGANGILEYLDATFGPLGITASGIEMLTRCRDDRLRYVNTAMGTLGTNDAADALVLDQPSDERKAASLALAEHILMWATTRSVVVPALPKTDFPPTLREIGAHMDAAMLDTLAAADGSGRFLLCEDRRFRMLAKDSVQQTGAWLQAAMIAAKNAGNMPTDAYYDSTIRMALAGHHFITLDAGAFMYLARQTAWNPEGRFRHLSRLIGSPNVELRSLIILGFTFLKELWSANLASNTKKGLSQVFLDEIMKQRPGESDSILRVFREHGTPPTKEPNGRRSWKRKAFTDFLDEYLRGRRPAAHS
jgi:tetratricopeptide (TPR) repeat protein